MNSETCEKLSVVCASLFGLASCGSLGAGTMAVGGAALALSLPAAIRSFRNWRAKPDDLIRRLSTAIESDWRTLTAGSGELDASQIVAASAALEGVLDLIEPDPQSLMRAGRDNAALINLVVEDARQRAPEDYAGTSAPRGASADRLQGDINARFLAAMLHGTLARLDGDPAFEAALAPWFQRAVFVRLDAIRDVIEHLPAELAAQIRDREGLVAELARVRAQFEATESLIARFLELMIGQSVPPDQFAATLYSNMERWKSVGERLGARELSANLSPEISRLKRQAELARANEQIDEVWRLIEEVDRIEQDYSDRLEQQQREIDETRNAHRLNRLQTKVTKRDVAIATYHLPEAARAIVDIIDIETPEPEARWKALWREQAVWYRRGRDRGVNLDLAVAIEIARIAVGRATGAYETGNARKDLGVALFVLGERESGTDRLEEAVAIYQYALRELTRERMPLDWAATQNNLGIALSLLGERESGTDRLVEAVAAYRDALKELTRERVSLDWAMTQNNLGNTLKVLGERASGTDRLVEAVAAYRDALKERTRERVPLQWAMTQNNLGSALQALGARETGTDRLEEAVVACHEALRELTRERVPLQWAMTQNNLGSALQALGARETGTDRLEEAVVAYHEALKELTRERVPLQWAMTQNNLGNALQALGVRETGTDRLEEAVAAYREALKELTRDRVPLQWGITQNNLGKALKVLGERESGTDRLEEAVAAYRAALEELASEAALYHRAIAERNLKDALSLLAER